MWGDILNKTQGISLAIAATLMITVLLFFSSHITKLENQKFQVNWMQQNRLTEAVERANQERNIAMGAIAIIEGIALVLLRTKDTKPEGNYQNESSSAKVEPRENEALSETPVNSGFDKENTIKKLIELRQQGILSEIEFIEKLEKINNGL